MNALPDRFSLKDKVVLLTGGTGIYGRGLTANLAATGATLIIASRNEGASLAVAEEESAQGHRVKVEQYDQGDERSIEALCSRITERHGRIDGLVNNSVLRPMTGVDGAASEFAESMRINATGMYLMHRFFGAAMARQKSGSIVNIGSIQGMVGPHLGLYEGLGMPPAPPDYFFHKGGVINLTRYYAGLLGPENVRVNCISPGGFLFGQPAEFIARYAGQTMLGRMAGKDDLSGAVIFLLGDAAAYITGVNLPVDGGYTAK